MKKLTNIETRITFFQYGEPKVFTYRGKTEQAKQAFNSLVKGRITAIAEITKDGYLVQGSHSIENAN